jgi:cytochrome c biogenesis protein CcmG/thiol:disulfide interchange protein DsbE
MSLEGWLGAARRAAGRHTVTSGVLVACVVAAVTVTTVTGTAGGSGTTKHADPVAKAFSLPALGQAGQRISLSSYAGQPVVLNFFASWCVPCRAETPLLARFYKSAQGKVAIVGLDENDSEASALKFVHTARVTYPVAFDPSVSAGTAYGVIAIPQTYFLDAAHHIVKHIFGALTQRELNSWAARLKAAPASHSPTSATPGAPASSALSGSALSARTLVTPQNRG